MGASIFISLEPKVASAGPDSVDGKGLSRALNTLDAILARHRRPTLRSFISMSGDEMEDLMGDDDGLVVVRPSSASQRLNASFFKLIQGLSAGVHTFKLQWKVNSGTATLLAGSGTANGDIHPQFFVREVS